MSKTVALVAIVISAWILSACSDSSMETSVDHGLESGDTKRGLVRSAGTTRGNSLEISNVDQQAELLGNCLNPECYIQRLDLAISRFQKQLEYRFSDDQRRERNNYQNPLPLTLWLEHSTRDIARLNLGFLAQRSIHDNQEWRRADTAFQARMRAHRNLLQNHKQIIQGIARDHHNPPPGLSEEDRRLIAQSWLQLQRAGAFLEPAQADALDRIETDLNDLQRQFDDNLRRETLRYELPIRDLNQLAGLPPSSVELARQDAHDRGFTDAWVLTLNAHSLFPALRNLHNRKLREQLYRAWLRRAGGMRVGQLRDNPDLMRQILELRLQRAQLFDHSHALSYQLNDSSMGASEQFLAMLDQLEAAAQQAAFIELDALRQLMLADGVDAEPRPWDFTYYQARLEATEREPAPANLEMTGDRVLAAMFALSNMLWGLEFEPDQHQTGPTPGRSRFSVHSSSQQLLGHLNFDLLTRPGKRGGAWMSVHQHAHQFDGTRQPAIVSIQTNFQNNGEDVAVLSGINVETLFHEFGHALMELMSDTKHRSLAGNQLPTDALEFPALVFERFAFEPDQRQQLFTTPEDRPRPNYKSPLPGLRTLQQIAAIRVDLAWHTIENGKDLDPLAIKNRVIKNMELPAVLNPHETSPGYREQFVRPRGGLLYRRLWAEMLAADVVAYFDTTNTTEQTAQRLLTNIFSRGHSRDLLESIEEFLGRPVSVNALICERQLSNCTRRLH